MKITELKDDETVYTLLTSGDFFLGRVAYLSEHYAEYIKEKVLEFCPGTVIVISKTVASDLPRDFDFCDILRLKKLTDEDKLKLKEMLANVSWGKLELDTNTIERTEE